MTEGGGRGGRGVAWTGRNRRKREGQTEEEKEVVSLKYPGVGSRQGKQRGSPWSPWSLADRSQTSTHSAWLTADSRRLQGLKKVRLVWLGYLWSRNSATDTRCHPMMDQWKRSRSGGEEGRTGHLIATQGWRKTNLSRQAMCPSVKPRTTLNFCCGLVGAAVCFPALHHRWKAPFVYVGPRGLSQTACSSDRVMVNCHLGYRFKTNLTPDL